MLCMYVWSFCVPLCCKEAISIARGVCVCVCGVCVWCVCVCCVCVCVWCVCVCVVFLCPPLLQGNYFDSQVCVLCVCVCVCGLSLPAFATRKLFSIARYMYVCVCCACMCGLSVFPFAARSCFNSQVCVCVCVVCCVCVLCVYVLCVCVWSFSTPLCCKETISIPRCVCEVYGVCVCVCGLALPAFAAGSCFSSQATDVLGVGDHSRAAQRPHHSAELMKRVSLGLISLPLASSPSGLFSPAHTASKHPAEGNPVHLRTQDVDQSLRGDPGQRGLPDPVEGREVATVLLRCWGFLPGDPAHGRQLGLLVEGSSVLAVVRFGGPTFPLLWGWGTIHCTIEQHGWTLPRGAPSIHSPGCNNQNELQRLPCVSQEATLPPVKAPSWNHTHSRTGTTRDPNRPTSKEKASGKMHTP